MPSDLIKSDAELLEMTTDIVSAYVSNNPVPIAELARVISDTYGAIRKLQGAAPPKAEEKPTPAVPIKKSVTPDFIICLEDGKKFKSLKRHLGIHYGLSPDAYRAKWGLPSDYPMVAPNYAAVRSAMAKAIGLGRKPVAPEPEAAPAKRRKIGIKTS
ncbi:MucR family transcriptional regulator [Mesorhizobium sp. M0815]|uniref:MucR family transcriptional regulator n=1 Tax=unclassified Mesorhizobium TaxID=325217 RepID=UPI0033370E92